MKLSLLLCMLFCIIFVVNVKSGQQVMMGDMFQQDQSEWLDPGDMLRYDSATKTMIKRPRFGLPNGHHSTDSEVKKSEEPQEKLCRVNSPFTKLEAVSSRASQCNCTNLMKNAISEKSDYEKLFFKRFINHLLAHLRYDSRYDENEVVYNVQMKVTERDIKILENFVSTKPKPGTTIHEVDNVLIHLIQKVTLYNPEFNSSYSSWTDVCTTWIRDNFLVVASIGYGILSIHLFRRLSAMGIILFTVMNVFVLSVPFEYMHMYQTLEARKMAERMKLSTLPEECDRSKATVLGGIWRSIKVDFFGAKDPCHQYYENIMIDTKYEINPSMAAVSLLGKLGEVASKSFGKSFGQFFNGLLLNDFSIFTRLIVLGGTILIMIAGIKYMGAPLINNTRLFLQSSFLNRGRNMIEDVRPEGGNTTQIEATSRGVSNLPAGTTVNQYYITSSNKTACPCSAKMIAKTATSTALKTSKNKEQRESVAQSITRALSSLDEDVSTECISQYRPHILFDNEEKVLVDASQNTDLSITLVDPIPGDGNVESTNQTSTVSTCVQCKM